MELDTRKVDWRQVYGEAHNFLRETEGHLRTPNLAFKNGLRIYHIAKLLAKDLWQRELDMRRKVV